MMCRYPEQIVLKKFTQVRRDDLRILCTPICEKHRQYVYDFCLEYQIWICNLICESRLLAEPHNCRILHRS